MPEDTTHAFKEWAIVCDAIANGRQHLILRKGGISEGRGGFRFEHREFYLFPTAFHEQVARTTLPPNTPLPTQPAGQVTLATFARVTWAREITDLDTALRLAPFHILRDEVVRERFHYALRPARPDGATGHGIHVALVRAYRVEPPWTLPTRPEFGGCKSWIELPSPPQAHQMTPAIDDAAHADIARQILEAIAPL